MEQNAHTGAIWERRVGPYEVGEQLGRGTFSVVFRARHRESGREVALKILDPTHPDSESVSRFAREARIAGQLVDPAIPAIHEIGTDRSRHYIAMELVEGSRLDERLLVEERLTARQVGEIAVQLARALSAAHALGVVHRDVKPANLVLTPDGRLRLLDFGLSHMVGVHSLSEPGVLVGTVPYMSPEQILGHPVDARSDLYSASVVFYELLAGRRPFPGDRFETVTHAILNLPPPRLTSLGVPEVVERVVRKGLAKRPDDRYESAQAMLRDWELVSAHADADSVPLLAGVGVLDDPAPEVTIPFRGRDAILERIDALVARARDGQGRLIAVGAEPGGGRSRLLRELREQALANGLRTILVEGIGGGATRPFHVWTAILDQYLSAEGVHDRAARRSLFRAMGRGVRPDVLELLASAEDVDPSRDGAAPIEVDVVGIRRTMAGFLAFVTEREPLLLLVDDLEKADPSSRALLAHVSASILRRRLVVVTAVRGDRPPTFAEAGDDVGDVLAAARADDALVEIRLPRLEVEDVVEIAHIRYGADASITAMARRLHQESEGIPLLVVEVLRLLESEDRLSRDVDGRWVAQDLGDVPIPTRIVDLLEQRLAGIDEGDRELLEAMSVSGEPALSAVLACCVASAPLAVLRRLRRLEERGLVVSGERGFRFAQAKMREYLHGRLPDELARTYHLQAAEGMAALDELDRVDPLDVAEHFLAAGSGARAVPFLERGGDRQFRLFANEAALSSYERAQEILEDLGDPTLLGARCRLGRRIASVEIRLGRTEEAVMTASLHARLAGKAGHLGLRGELLLTLGEARAERGEEEVALDAVEEARAAFRAAGDAPGEARTLDLEGRIEQRRGRLDAALDLYRRSLQTRERGAPDAVGKSRYLIGMCLRRMGRLEESASELIAARTELETTGDVINAAGASGELGNVYFLQRRYDRAAEEFDAFLRVMRESGERARLASALTNAASAELYRGRFSAARALYREALEIRLEFGDPRRIGALWANLAFVFFYQARFRDAILAAHDGREHAEKAGDARSLALSLGFAGLIHLELGETEAALRSFHEALDAADDPRGRLVLLTDRSLATAEVDPGLARRHLAEAEGMASGAAVDVGWEIQMATAAIEVADGNPGEAIIVARRAVELSREAGDFRRRTEAATLWVSLAAASPGFVHPDLVPTLERTLADALDARLRGMELRLRVAQAEIVARERTVHAVATLKLALSVADQIMQDVPPRSRVGWASRSGYSRALDLLERWGGDDPAIAAAVARRRDIL